MDLSRSVLAAAVALLVAATSACTEPAPPKPRAGPHLFLSGKYGDLWRVAADGGVTHAKFRQLDPGDPQHHLLRRGRSLVGWGYETYLLDPDLEDPPKLLVDDSLFFIPSAHDDRVWITTEYRDPDTKGLVATVREVSLDGTVTVPDVRPPHGGWLEASLRSGLLFSRGGKRFVWDPETREVVFRFRSEDLGPTHEDLVVWCEARCETLHVTNAGTGEERTIDPPAGFGSFRAWEGEFSPDGETIALPVRAGERHAVQLALVDFDDGTATTVDGTATAEWFNFVEWSATGSHVFFTGAVAYESEERVVFVHEVGGSTRRLDVSVGKFFDAAAI